MVSLYSATGVDPEVLETVGCSALAAETELRITRLEYACPLKKLLIRDLLVCCPGVRENGVRKRMAVVESGQLEAIIAQAALEKVHNTSACSPRRTLAGSIAQAVQARLGNNLAVPRDVAAVRMHQTHQVGC